MISYKTWKEDVGTATTPTAGQSEVPTEADYNYYSTQLSGNLKRYLQWLVTELEKSSGKLTLVRKGFVMQEVMDALGLNPAQVTRLSNNIKKGFMAWQAAQSKTTPNQGPAPAPIM